MKLTNIYCFLLIFLLACGTDTSDQATTEETDSASTESSEANTEEENTEEEEISEGTDPEENIEYPEDEVSNTDFILGYWKITSYEIPGLDDLGFHMAQDVHITSYYDFIIDNSYKIMNNSEMEYGDEDGKVESGTWEISEDQSTMTLTLDITDEVQVWAIEELESMKIVLSRNHPAYNNKKLTMVIESMGE